MDLLAAIRGGNKGGLRKVVVVAREPDPENDLLAARPGPTQTQTHHRPPVVALHYLR